jgi:hypothetical protein
MPGTTLATLYFKPWKGGIIIETPTTNRIKPQRGDTKRMKFKVASSKKFALAPLGAYYW